MPYCFTTEDGLSTKESYYCQKAFLKKYSICGSNSCPILTEAITSYRCQSGYYLIITSDKFNTQSGSFKSRLISPIYSNQFKQNNNLCFNFVYNIYSQTNDGFNLYLENYLNSNDLKLLDKIQGPLTTDKWYNHKVYLQDITFTEFRVSFDCNF